jgi:hypothetical protein
MATIRKRGTKWQAQVRCLGIAPITRSFLQRADAAAWAKQVEAVADRRGLPGNLKALDKTTLGDVLVRFRDTVVALRKSRDVETIILNAILRQPFTRQPLSYLNASHFCENRDLRLNTVQPVTINRELWLMQHALDVAAKEWAIPLQRNPLRELRKPKAGQVNDVRSCCRPSPGLLHRPGSRGEHPRLRCAGLGLEVLKQAQRRGRERDGAWLTVLRLRDS